MRDEVTTMPRERLEAQAAAPGSQEVPSRAWIDSPRLHVRVRHGMRRSHNWWQLVRFGLTGVLGYLVNVGTFALLIHAITIDYRVAATLSFVVGMTFSFFANRHFTFRGCEGRAHRHAWRFVVVSLVAYGAYLLVLLPLYELTGLAESPAQALAAALVAPVSFVGNKLWSFRP